MMKYKDFFSEVQSFTADLMVLSIDYTKEEALKLFREVAGDDLTLDEIAIDRVRFGFPPDEVEGGKDFDGPIWYTGAYGKGSKKVWIIRQ